MSKKGSGSLESAAPATVRFEVDVRGLYVKRVMLGSDHEISMATFGVHPQNDKKDVRFEQVWSIAKKGQRVTVKAKAGETTPKVLFHGWITDAQIRAGGRMEDIEYTALGLEWGLKVEKVFGSWCVDKGGNAVWLRGTQTVFNKDGRYNRLAVDATDGEGNARTVFTLDDAQDNPIAVWWHAQHMVRYLVAAERKSELSSKEGRLFKTTYLPSADLSDFRPFDVNVEGEDIWSAIVKIAHLCSLGVRMKFGKDRDKPELDFFTKKLDEAKVAKQFEMPQATLENLQLSDYGKTIASLDVQDDLSGIVRQVDAVTPPKLFDAKFELVAGWSKIDEAAALGGGALGTRISNFIRETDPETSTDWARFKDVGRRWILNETGRDVERSGFGKPYDFSAQFGVESWAIRLRPFRHTRAKTDHGVPLPITLHASWKNMTDDISLGHNVEMIHDRAGVYFRGRPLIQPNIALDEGNIDYMFPTGVSIEATVEGDQDSPHDVHGLLSGDDMPVPTFGLVRLDDGFRESNAEDTEDAVREKAQKLCDEAVTEHKFPRLIGTAVIPWISFQFEVGDVIDKIKGRNLAVKAQIAKISYDAETQATEIALHFPEIDTQSHNRHATRMHGAGVGYGNEVRSPRGLQVASDLLAIQERAAARFGGDVGWAVGLAAQDAAAGRHMQRAEKILGDMLYELGVRPAVEGEEGP